MDYIDGYVLAVPTAKKQDYTDFANEAAQLFRDHGALRVVECWGDDIPDGKLTSFPMAVKLAKDESVVFSWIAWPDRATRDKGMAAVMADERMSADTPIPFDGARMIMGSFQTIVDV